MTGGAIKGPGDKYRSDSLDILFHFTSLHFISFPFLSFHFEGNECVLIIDIATEVLEMLDQTDAAFQFDDEWNEGPHN